MRSHKCWLVVDGKVHRHVGMIDMCIRIKLHEKIPVQHASRNHASPVSLRSHTVCTGTRVILKLLSVMFGQVGHVDNVLNSIAQQNDQEVIDMWKKT